MLPLTANLMSNNPMDAHISQTSVINISRLFESDAPADFQLDQKIVDALRHQGSFVCIGYPGWEGLEQRARCITEFFSLPDEMKLSIATQQVTSSNSNGYRGYYPPPKVRGWSDKERLDIGPEPPLEAPLLQGGAIFRESNRWPVLEPHEGWRRECLAHFAQIREITVALMDAIARGLGLDNIEFKRLYHGRNGTVRLLNYLSPSSRSGSKAYVSSLEMVDDGRRWIIGQEHVDTTVLTLLWQNKKGLQMKDSQGYWRDVPVVPGGLSLHCGDVFNRLTNGVINAARHRVVGDGESRMSLAMFLEPDWATKVDPPDVNAPLTYAAHLLNIFSARLEKQIKTSK